MQIEGIKFINRRGWGAVPPGKRYTKMDKIKRLVIHHSATLSKFFKHPNTIQAIQNYHIQKGWNDIGYHYILSPKGDMLYEGRPANAVGAHCGINPAEKQENRVFGNDGSLGLCIIGNYDEESVPQTLIESIKFVIEKLCSTYEIPLNEIYGHFEAWIPGKQLKTCPGKNMVIALFGKWKWNRYFLLGR